MEEVRVSDEVRLRELLQNQPLTEDAKGDVERIFKRSAYTCMLCMIKDYGPPSAANPDHTH